jgi:hypothetical protein
MRRLLSPTRARILAVLVVSTVVGIGAAAYNVGKLPFGKMDHGLAQAAATVHIQIDAPVRSLSQQHALPQDLRTLEDRSELLGRLLVSRPGLDAVGAQLGIPGDQISGLSRTFLAPQAMTEPNSERRAAQIVGARKPFHLEVQTRPWTPVLDVFTQAPSTKQAEALANAAVPALRQQLAAMAAESAVSPDGTLRLRQLGTARGAIVDPSATKEVVLLTFVTAFGLTAAAMSFLLVVLLRRRGGADVAMLRRRRERALALAGQDENDAWPHTTRLLPWMLAAFLAVLWLVPFNVITLNASLPIDLNFDRLVLPFILVMWLFALAAGGRGAPRIQLTWIHGAVALLVAVAFLSVVVDARYLAHTLELDLAVKKLPLLLSYTMVFLLVSSSVRAAEVKPMLTYSLVLCVMCALGMLWEYRFKQNLFYEASHKIFEVGFSVGQDRAKSHDSIGRRLVSGPAEEPLEAVTMLCIGLPIALVRFLYARKTVDRLLYTFAVSVIMAATFATFRKSGLLAPVAILMTVAYFRRGDLLKFAPLGLVSIGGIAALSPGAIRSTVNQFTRSDATAVGTVSDRTSDYDAVRPDVWSHIFLGRGWGTYQHNTYRVLDSEILMRTVETGVIGLVAFVFLSLVVMGCARGVIVRDDREWAPQALIGAAAAAGFLVISALYDVLSFPHGTYLFFVMAAFMAVVIKAPTPVEVPDPAEARDARGHARALAVAGGPA